jgi:hypothetical protein
MAKPEEVADNVAVLLDMAAGGGLNGKAAVGQHPAAAKDLAPASADAANGSGAAANGLSSEEAAVLGKIRRVLQPVKDMTWPVGLTDNRK